MAIFNDNIDEVTQNYNNFRGTDPFPEVYPALLNSADVSNYIKTIGMVAPFDDELLNGVTLSLKVGDTGVYWDKDKKKVKTCINNETNFTLKSNSIAYVTIEEELRLPAYIIARFNLRVTNAYRGILLGTGPIVDPGFVGKLNIPLHNLTNSDYVFTRGEALIEMEFTKISKYKDWIDEDKIKDLNKTTDGEYKKWKPTADKRDVSTRNIEYYLNRANQGKEIQSSLPNLSHQTEEAIDKVNKTAEKVDNSLNRINVGLLFSFGTLLGAVIAIVNVFRGDIKEIKDKKYDDKIQYLQKQHENDSIRMDSFEAKLKKV